MSSPVMPKPFSFKPGSGSAPSSPLARNSPSRKASESSKDGKGESSSGLLGRHEETTFHRQLRSLLQDHKKARSAWEEQVTYDGLQAVSSYTQADEDVGRLDASLAPAEKGTAQAADDSLAARELVYAKEQQLASALFEREDALSSLREVIQSLNAQVLRMTTIQKQVHNLLLEASSARGLDFAFQTPVWGTWTMDTFSEHINDLTSQHVLATAQLEIAIDALLSSGVGGKGADAPDEAQLEKMSAREKEAVRARRRERLSEAWAMLPFLHKSGPRSARYFDEACTVEVGRWEGEKR